MKKMRCFFKCIKPRLPSKKGFTLTELIVAIGLSALFTGVILTALTSSRQICTSVSADQDLQQTANVLMTKIIKGDAESGVTYRLSEAVSYTITSQTPSPGVVYYTLSFIGTDGVTRTYFQDGNGLWYNHPAGLSSSDELLYRAPAGTTLTLRFWPQVANITVGIDVGLSKTVNGRTVTGSAATMITIRNHVT